MFDICFIIQNYTADHFEYNGWDYSELHYHDCYVLGDKG